MYPVTVVADARADVDKLPDQFAGLFDMQITSVQQALRSNPGAVMLFDIDLTKSADLPQVGEWLRRRPAHAKAIFLIDKASHLQQTRASSLGATDILLRPINCRELVTKLLGDVTSLSADPENEVIRNSPAVCAAVNSLRDIFSSARLGGKLDTPSVKTAGEQIISQVEAQGIAAWIETVRTHHSATYQHCLLGHRTGGRIWTTDQSVSCRSAAAYLSPACSTTSARQEYRLPFSKSQAAWTDDEMEVMKAASAVRLGRAGYGAGASSRDARHGDSSPRVSRRFGLSARAQRRRNFRPGAYDHDRRCIRRTHRAAILQAALIRRPKPPRDTLLTWASELDGIWFEPLGP